MTILETRTQAPPRGGIFLPQDLVEQATYALERDEMCVVDVQTARHTLHDVIPRTVDEVEADRAELSDYIRERGAPFTKQREEVFAALAKLYVSGLPDNEKVSGMKAALNKLRLMYRGSETTPSESAFKRQQVIGFACLMHVFDESIPPWLPDELPPLPDSHAVIAQKEQLKHDAALRDDIAGNIYHVALELQHSLAVDAQRGGFAGWSMNGHHYMLAEYPLDGTPYLQTYDPQTDYEIHFTVADLRVVSGNVRNATPDDARTFLQHSLAAHAVS